MKWLGKIIFVLLASQYCLAADWDNYVDKKVPADTIPIITNRQIIKTGSLQLIGQAGFSDRQDLYSHNPVSLTARYHFSERHAWEVFRVAYDFYSLTGVAQDVVKQTGYQVDSVQAYWSLTSGYVLTPIYGKYALSDSAIVHFEMYAGASVGARFAPSQVQMLFEPLIGASHYLTPKLAILLPELRVRLYQEKRSGSTDFVSEVTVLGGLSWLF